MASYRNKTKIYKFQGRYIHLPPEPKITPASKEVYTTNLNTALDFYKKVTLDLPEYQNYIRTLLMVELATISECLHKEYVIQLQSGSPLEFLKDLRDRWLHLRLTYEISERELNDWTSEISTIIDNLPAK